ncbi:hypothetical protein AMBR_MGDJBKAP_00014 [Leuconostoc pseudomesenteroides]|nr:hypothetical protein AMBR_MGDJBKAP_00014 [Leuconostoc pseudomesenteroides]
MNRTQTQRELGLWKKENNRKKIINLSSTVLPVVITVLTVPFITWILIKILQNVFPNQ